MAYIYALTDPRDGAIRYVGKADDPARRLVSHLQQRTKARTWKNGWITQLTTLGLTPGVTVLEDVGTGDWRAAERHWIAAMRAEGHRLTNGTDGGEGGYVPAAQTPEARAKRSASHLANGRKYYTPERAAKISAAQKGREVSDEARVKIAQARARQVIGAHTSEAKEKMSRASKGRPKSPKHREAMAQARAGVVFTGRPVLLEEQVLVIRRRVAEGEVQAQLAREYGVSQATVSNIVRRKVWRHI